MFVWFFKRDNLWFYIFLVLVLHFLIWVPRFILRTKCILFIFYTAKNIVTTYLTLTMQQFVFTLIIFTLYRSLFYSFTETLRIISSIYAILIGYIYKTSHIFNSLRGLILLLMILMSIVSCRKEFVRRFDRFVFKYEWQYKPHCGLLSCTTQHERFNRSERYTTFVSRGSRSSSVVESSFKKESAHCE